MCFNIINSVGVSIDVKIYVRIFFYWEGGFYNWIFLDGVLKIIQVDYQLFFIFLIWEWFIFVGIFNMMKNLAIPCVCERIVDYEHAPFVVENRYFDGY